MHGIGYRAMLGFHVMLDLERRREIHVVAAGFAAFCDAGIEHSGVVEVAPRRTAARGRSVALRKLSLSYAR
jgi:hypothetical protein